METSSVKERPMLFSGPMVRAILEGRKTQTRRIVNLERWMERDEMNLDGATSENIAYLKVPRDSDGTRHRLFCPYGQVGDSLWVKESFYAYGFWQRTGAITKTGKKEMTFLDLTEVRGLSYIYPSTDTELDQAHKNDPTPQDRTEEDWYLRPSIFMHRSASRITLEITNVSVERLQDITYDDIIAEGLKAEDITCPSCNDMLFLEQGGEVVGCKNDCGGCYSQTVFQFGAYVNVSIPNP